MKKIKLKSRLLSTTLAAIMLAGQIASPAGSVLAVSMDYTESGSVESEVNISDTIDISGSADSVISEIPNTDASAAIDIAGDQTSDSVDLTEGQTEETGSSDIVLSDNSEIMTEQESENDADSSVDLTESTSENAESVSLGDTEINVSDDSITESNTSEETVEENSENTISEESEDASLVEEKEPDAEIVPEKEESSSENNEDTNIVEQDSVLTESKDNEKNIEEIRASYFTEPSEDINLEGDFSSCRLIVATENADVIVDRENIMSEYNGVYLMQYLSEEQARNAYSYYSTKADMVAPDMEMTAASEDSNEPVSEDETVELYTDEVADSEITEDLVEKTDVTQAEEIAENKQEITETNTSDITDISVDTEIVSVEENIADENITDEENIAETIVAEDGLTSEENPLTELNKQIETDAEESDNHVEINNDESPLIALIDTGATENDNIVSRVSMLGDAVEDDNGHGDQMVEYILEEDPEARILSIKALDKDGKGTVSSVYAAMEYALTQGAKIINLSVSAYSTDENAVLSEIVNRAVESGVIVVGAAGNKHANAKYFVPGNIEAATIVGSVDGEGNLQDVSNFGKTVDYYVYSSSTSEAAARMSGILSGGILTNGRVYNNERYQLVDMLPEEEDGEFSVAAVVNDFLWAHDSDGSKLWINADSSAVTLSNCAVKIKFGNGTEATYNATPVTHTDQNRSFTLRVDLDSTYSNWGNPTNVTLINKTTGSALATIQSGLYPEFTVVFDGNGGTDGGSRTVRGNRYITSLPTSTRTGYTFDGWYTNLSGGNKLTTTTKVNSTIATRTYVAHWTPNTYTVKYNANGGSGAPGSQTKTHGVNLTLSTTKPTKAAVTETKTATFNANWGSSTGATNNKLTANATTSYTFSKWNTAANGSGTDYSSGGTYAANTSATLYAQYNSSTTYGSITLPTPARTGYTCTGWYTTSSGGTKVGDPGNSYQLKDNITLYAQWSANAAAVQPITQSASLSVVRGARQNWGAQITTDFTSFASQGYVLVTVNFPSLTIYGDAGVYATALSLAGSGVIYKQTDGTLSTTSGNGATVYHPDGIDAYLYDPDTFTYTFLVDPTFNGYTMSSLTAATTAGTTARTNFTTTLVNKAKAASTGSTGAALGATSWYWDMWNVIKYDGNGDGDSVTNIPSNTGNLQPVTSQYVSSRKTSLTVSAQVPFRAGYTFKGWNTQPDGSGTSYNGGDAYSTYSTVRGLKLYAQWQKNQYSYSTEHWANVGTGNGGNNQSGDSFRIDTTYGSSNPVWNLTTDPIDAATYNAHSQGGTYTGTYTSGDLVTISNNTPMLPPNGFEMNPKYQAPLFDNGTVSEYDFGDEMIAPGRNSRVYFVYEPINYSITYNMSGGGTNNASNPTSYSVMNPATFLAPTRSGYDFVEWRDQYGNTYKAGDGVNNGTGSDFQNTFANGNDFYNKMAARQTGDLVLTPVWEAPYTLKSAYWAKVPAGDGNNTWNGSDAFRLDSSFDSSTAPNYPDNIGDEAIYNAHSNGAPYIQKFAGGDELTITKESSMDPPNGYELKSTFGTSNISGSWATYPYDEPVTMPNRNVTIERDYLPITYSITYNMSEGGTNNASNPASYTVVEPATFLAPTREGYEFKGWKDQNGNVYQAGDGINTGSDPAYQNTFANGNDFYTKMAARRTGNVIMTPMWRKLTTGQFVDESTGLLPRLKETENNKGKFKIVEIKQTPGYILQEPYPEQAVNILTATLEDGKVVATFDNTPNEFVIKKQDSRGNALAGATFVITSPDGNSRTEITSDGSGTIPAGEIHVKRAIPGDWTYQETAAPEGYQIDNTVYTVHINTDGTVDGGAVRPVVVDPDKGEFYIRKVDESGNPLAGVTFTLTNVPGMTTATTGIDGMIHLTNLTEGTYTYKESALPAGMTGYIVDSSTHTFTVSADGTITVSEGGEDVESSVGTVVNRRNRLKLVKQDENGTALKGAVIEIQKDGSSFQTVTLGETELTGLANGTYRYRETTAPAGYLSDGQWHELCTVTNGLIDGAVTKTITIENPENEVVLQKNASGSPLEGAQIRITGPDGTEYTQTTNVAGQVILNKLKPGIYSFKEIKAPDGYVLSDNAKGTFTIAATGQVTYSYDQGTAMTNNQNRMKVKKVDETGAAVQGAVFSFTYSGSGTDPFSGTKTTNASGEIELSRLPEGSYTFTETSAPTGLVKDTATHTFTVDGNGVITAGGAEVTIAGDCLTIQVTNNHQAKMNVTLTKNGSDGTTNLTGASFKLVNTDTNEERVFTENSGTYTITNIPVDSDDATEYQIVEVTPPAGYVGGYTETFTVEPAVNTTIEKTFTAENNPNELLIGKTDSATGELLSGAVFALYQGATAVKTGTTVNGLLSFKKIMPGTYSLREQTAPAGYQLNNTSYTVTVGTNGLISINGGTASAKATQAFANTKIPDDPNRITLIKKDSADNAALAGVEFELRKGASVVGKYYTDSTGSIVIDALEPGTYTLVETAVPEGYLDNPVTVNITVAADRKVSIDGGTAALTNTKTVTNTKAPHNKITLTKVDADDNTKVLSGVVFEIRKGATSVATVSTNSAGQFSYTDLAPGTYTIKETIPKSGYLNDMADITFTVNNDMTISSSGVTTALEVAFQGTNHVEPPAAENKFTLTKKDSSTNSPLVGVEFELKRGTTVVGSYFTNASGEIVLTKLIEGSYTLREVEVPEGYEDNPVTVAFTVAANGTISVTSGGTALSNTAALENGATVTNTPKPVVHNKVTVVKKDRDNSSTVIPGVTFKIERNGTEIDTQATNSSGSFELNDLEPGNYVITETIPAEGYNNDADPITFTVGSDMKIDGVLEKTYTVTDSKIPEIHNKLTVNKKDSASNEVITGVGFELRTVPAGTVLDTYYTDTNGDAVLEDIPEGSYTLVETEPKEGYQDEHKTVNFTVDAEGKITLSTGGAAALEKTTELTNTKIPEPNHNKITFVKTELGRGNPVKGVMFQLTKDGNPLSDAATDEDGKIEIADLEPGNYVLTETQAADGFIDDQIVISFVVNADRYIVYNSETPVLEKTISLTNTREEPDPENNKLTVYKTDADHGEPVPGVTFELRQGSTVVETFVTDENGSFTYENLDAGNYTLVETIPAAGYNNDHLSLAITVNAYGQIVYNGETPALEKEIRVTNTRPNGIDIYKTDEDGETPIANVSFELRNGSTVVGTVTTDAYGHGSYNNIPEGNYTLVETVPAEGYLDEGITFTFRVDNAGKLYKEGEAVGQNRLKYEATNISDTPDPHPVHIVKQDPNGEPLTGAGFDLYEWNGTEYVKISGQPVLPETDAPDIEDDTPPVGETEAGMYYFTDNGDGTYDLSSGIYWTKANQGKFKVVESRTPEGYAGAWEQEITVPKDADRGKEEAEKTYSFTVVNEPNKLTVNKILNPAGSAIGTKFTFGRDPSTVDENVDLAYDSIEEYTIEAGSALTFEKIPDGTYFLEEILPPAGYIRDSVVHTVTVENGYIHVDSDAANKAVQYSYSVTNTANKLIVVKTAKDNPSTLLSGAVFTATNTQTGVTRTATTNAQGQAIFEGLASGEYTIEETSAPGGYALSADSYIVNVQAETNLLIDAAGSFTEVASGTLQNRDYTDNIGQTGTVVVDKQNAAGAHLEGAVFGIWEYNRATGEYEGGTPVVTGYIDPADLADNVEQEPAEPGYVPNPETEDTVDDYGTDPIPVYYTPPKYTMTYSDGLYRSGDLTITANNLGKFKIEEIEAPDGYYGDWSAEIDLNEKRNWSFTEGADGAVTNEPAQFSIMKYGLPDPEENPGGDMTILEGARFKIWNDVDGADNAIVRTTDVNGLITLSNVHKNTVYHFKETKAPRGYKKVKGTVDIQVDSTGGVNGINNTTTIITNEPGTNLKKLIVNCIIDKAYPEYEDISFIYDINGVLDDNETIHFTMVLTPKGVITTAQAAKYVTPLTTTDSKIATGAIMTLPSGTYTVTQRKPQRYDLVEVYPETRTNVTVPNLTAVCDLTEEDVAESTFINVLKRWNMASSAAAATNHVGPEYEDPTAD